MNFESTKDSAESQIHTVIPLIRKILCDKSVWNGFEAQGGAGGVKYTGVFHQSRSQRDHLAPWWEMRVKAPPFSEEHGRCQQFLSNVYVYTGCGGEQKRLGEIRGR
ncbi:MAG: hypothetical protein HKP12_12805 [Gammaproteobacteria bacterium]|nr:hypothetical protein [Gammaproteobacteria bacterium]